VAERRAPHLIFKIVGRCALIKCSQGLTAPSVGSLFFRWRTHGARAMPREVARERGARTQTRGSVDGRGAVWIPVGQCTMQATERGEKGDLSRPRASEKSSQQPRPCADQKGKKKKKTSSRRERSKRVYDNRTVLHNPRRGLPCALPSDAGKIPRNRET
jgi:hypothetical protein